MFSSSSFLSSAVSRLLSGRRWTMNFFSRSSWFISSVFCSSITRSWQWLWYLDFCQDCFFSVFSLPLQSTCHWFCHPLMRIPPPAPESCISLLDLILFPLLFQDMMPLSYPPPQWLSACIPLLLLVPPQWLLSHIFPQLSAHGCWGCLQFFAQSLIRMTLAVLLVSHLLTPSALIWQSLCMHCKPRECHLWQGHLFHFSWALCISCNTIYCTHSILPGRVCFCQPLARFGCSLCNSTFPYFRPWRPWLPSSKDKLFGVI